MENINTNHNVYILGAGFSAEAGMPLISNFFEKMLEAANWLEENNRKNELQAIEEVLKLRKDATSAAYRIKLNIDNIEHLFSLASAIDQKNLSNATINAICATLDYCKSQHQSSKVRLRIKEENKKLLNIDDISNTEETILKSTSSLSNEDYEMELFNLYSYVLSGYHIYTEKQKNTIITFNYDTELENAFLRNRLPYNYGLTKAIYDFQIQKNTKNYSSTPIHKLHGSINWAFTNSEDKELTIYETYDDSCRKGNRRLLIPPTWQKSFNGHLQTVWKNAIESLYSATRIVIIGFSLPETDIHFKYLLAAGLRNNISLRKVIFVNPEEKEIMEPKILKLFQHEFIEQEGIDYIPLKAKNALYKQLLYSISRGNSGFYIQ
jgi:hypothetical protein